MALHVVLPGCVVRTCGTLVDVLVTMHLFQVAGEVVARDVLLAERTLKVKDLNQGTAFVIKLITKHLNKFLYPSH